MNEQQMTALMERAGSALAVDVDDLVARGAARGRSRRRRRTAATGLVAAAAVVGVAVVPVLLATDDESPRPAGPVRTVVDRDTVDETLLALLPGSRLVADQVTATRFPGEGYDREVFQATVRWRGTAIGVSIDARGVGTDRSAEQRCATFAAGQPCQEEAGGAWSYTYGSADLSPDGRTMEKESRVVRVYTESGYVVYVTATPASAAVGPGLLRAVALSDEWGL